MKAAGWRLPGDSGGVACLGGFRPSLAGGRPPCCPEPSTLPPLPMPSLPSTRFSAAALSTTAPLSIVIALSPPPALLELAPALLVMLPLRLWALPIASTNVAACATAAAAEAMAASAAGLAGAPRGWRVGVAAPLPPGVQEGDRGEVGPLSTAKGRACLHRPEEKGFSV